MNLSNIKLDAKKRLVKNNLKCFTAVILPFLTVAVLGVLNYYLYSFLLKFEFSQYDMYLKPAILTLSIVMSFGLWQGMRFLSERFFYIKSRNSHSKFFPSLKKLTFRRYFMYLTVSLLKFFLSVSWCALYFSPCAVVAGTFYYCFSSGGYSVGTLATLASSAVVLFFIGIAFLYVTLKRYSMCSALIFSCKENDSLKIIAKSIAITNGNLLKYSAYCLSFVGWTLSCIFILPAFYVLPYKKMAKYSFYDSLTDRLYSEKLPEKPIVFYITKEA